VLNIRFCPLALQSDYLGKYITDIHAVTFLGFAIIDWK